MENHEWIEHLNHWKEFLKERWKTVDEFGEKIKIERQLRTIERVRCGAVLNPSLLSDFVNPPEETGSPAVPEEYFLENLNDSQKNAVAEALSSSNLSLIQGPPGTGKTQVIAEICLQLYNRDPSVRILVCSETHVAVNNLLSRIADANDKIRIVRIRDKEEDEAVDAYSPAFIIEAYKEWAEASIQNETALTIIEEELDNTEDKSLEKSLALSSNIAGMTCNRAAAYDFRDTTEMFDVAIIDEVCKATLPEILTPLLFSRKAILLGDPQQLPPVFCSEERDIIRSIEDCNLDKYMYIDGLFEKSSCTHVLDTQYRMNNQIGDMISELFYQGAIKNGRDEDATDSLIWIDYKPSQEWPPKNEQEKDNPSVYNDEECGIVERIVRGLISENSTNKIAVIAPYRAQIIRLRRVLPQSDRVAIDTVDGFQGKESDIVIFSTTRTTGSFRFLSDKRRLNVALSRAKNKVIIVGNLNFCNKNPLLREVSKYCNITRG